MNNIPSSNRSRTSLIPLLYLGSAILMLIVLVALWRSQSRASRHMERLAAQNSQLKQELADAQAQITEFNSGDSSETARTRLDKARQTRSTETAPETETLFLEAPSVKETANGLKVSLTFNPADATALPEDLTLVVRVPGSGSASILSLKPAGPESGGANTSAIVNRDGHLAIIQCRTDELDTLEFEFTVTEPVTATIRGSEGVLDFELDITPDGCTVRKL